MTTLVLLASGLSPNMAENLFGQQAYGNLLWISIFAIIGSWQYLHSQRSSRYGWGALALLLVFLTAWGNPQRAIVYMVGPILAGAVAAWWRRARTQRADQHRLELRQIALYGLIALIVCVAGASLQNAVLNLNDGRMLAVVPAWLSHEGMAHNALAAIRGLISLVGGFPDTGGKVIKLSGMLDGARFCAGIVLLALLPWGLRRALLSPSMGRVYFAAATSALLVVSALIFLTTTVPDTTDPIGSIRYMVPALIGALFNLVQTVIDDEGAPVKRSMAFAAGVVLALTAPVSYSLNSRAHFGLPSQEVSATMTTAAFLQSQHAQYGYASFWNAGNTTVISSHTVRVRQIEITDGLPRPQRWLSSDRWYEPAAWQGPTFLYLSKPEAASIDWAKMQRLAGEPRRRLAHGEMVYIEYDHNIAADLPLWSFKVMALANYPASATALHLVGDFDASREEIRAAPGTAGVLRFGPYETLAPGRYDVTFELRAEGDAGQIFGQGDVVAGGAKEKLAQASITRTGPQRLLLSFTTEKKLSNVEYRILSNGTGALAWHSVLVEGHPLTAPAAAARAAR